MLEMIKTLNLPTFSVDERGKNTRVRVCSKAEPCE